MAVAEKITEERTNGTTAAEASAAGQSGMELINVSKGYGEEWNFEQVLGNLSLELEPGKLTVIIGPSGCGKSTLVGLVAGFESPGSGKVLIDGNPVTGPAK